MEDYRRSFEPSTQEGGTAAAAGQGSKPDERREDVGWDRISSDGDDEGEIDEVERKSRDEIEREAGPIADADAPAPPG
jgi:hypothetical protein